MRDMSNKTLLEKNYFKIFGVVALYWVVSISLVFINKTLLSSQNDGQILEAPLFFTWFQCVIAVLLYYVITLTASRFLSMKLPNVTIDCRVMLKVCPLSIVFVTMMTFNNLCLKHLGVSFYYVGRSLVHIFNVLLSFYILGEKTSRRSLLCCSIILAGFLLGVEQEGATGSLSTVGTFYGILSSIFLALNSIYTKKLLVVVHQSVWLLGFYNNVNACLLFVPLMILHGEIPILMSYEGFFENSFWVMMIAGGIFGFAVNYVMALQIQLTSPLTNTISGTAKACAQTVMATHFYGEMKPFLWWTSNWVVLLGGAAYARVRQLEMERKHLANNMPDNQLSHHKDKTNHQTV